MSLHASVRTAAFAAAVSILTASGASAQSTYINAGSGLWNDAANWSAGVPTNATAAILDVSTPGNVTLGSAAALSLRADANYTLLGGQLVVGNGTNLSATNGVVTIADGFALTLADNSIAANTLDNNIRFISTALANTPATVAGNGIIRLGASQSGLNTVNKIAIGNGTTGVTLEFTNVAALGNGVPVIEFASLGGGNFQFGGQDIKYDGAPGVNVPEFRNEIALLRHTGGSNPITISNPLESSSPFRYLFFQNTGSTVTLSGNMVRFSGNNQRLGTVASWGGTTLQLGAPTVGGNADYQIVANTATGLTGNLKGNGMGVASINGKVEVYRANADTAPFSAAFGGGIAVSDTDLFMGLLTGVRGQDAGDVNAVSQIEFYNAAQGGAAADGNGISQYRFSTISNESARYQLPRGQNMVPLELIVNANTNVTINNGGAGVALDVRGDVVKKGDGTLSLLVTNGSGNFARGGVTSPGAATVPVFYEGLFDIQGGTVAFGSVAAVGRGSDDVFDGATGSNDEAGNGIINYRFAGGTTLRTQFLDTNANVGTYNMKSDVTIGTASGDVVTFDVLTGGGVAGKPMGMAAGIAAKANPTTTFNGTLVKTGAGQLTLGGGAARNYVANAGSGMTVSAGRVVVSSPNFNTPNLAVTNNALVQVTGTGNASVGSLVGTGSTEIAAGGKLRVGGGSNSQANLNNAGEFRGGGVMTLSGAYSSGGGSLYGTGIASASSFDRLVVTGAAGINGTLEIDMLGGYNPLPSDLFPIVTSSAVSGTFTNVNSWGLITVLGGGRAFVPQYGATDVVLTDYARVGDVNRDGAVNNLDIASFVGLLTGNPAAGSVGFAGDVNGDGVVNNLDIAPFVALLTGGRPVGDDPDFQPLLSLVPEPASLSLLALGGLMLGRRRRNV